MGVPESLETLLADLSSRSRIHKKHDEEPEREQPVGTTTV